VFPEWECRQPLLPPKTKNRQSNNGERRIGTMGSILFGARRKRRAESRLATFLSFPSAHTAGFVESKQPDSSDNPT
jgi:hypothetical protein